MHSDQPTQPSSAPDAPADDRPSELRPGRPTVDEVSDWSFPASDPPSSWTWETEDRPHPAGN